MESYIHSAWNIILSVIMFMSNTTILTIGGVNVTFLGLAIVILLFDIIIWVIFEVLDIDSTH